MKYRGYEAPLIDFDDKQLNLLVKALGKPANTAILFIDDIRFLLTHYTHITRDCQNDPPPTRTQINTHIRDAQKAAHILHGILSNCDAFIEHGIFTDAIGWTLLKHEDEPPDFSTLQGEDYIEARLNYELPFDAQAADLMERLERDSALLSESLANYLRFARSARRGRPSNMREVVLIKDIAESYRKHFGKLPPAHSRSRFHDFVVLALEYAGYPQQSWHRAIKPAIDLLKSPPTD